jgi:hypothetical protein
MEQQAADAPAIPAQPGPADPIRIFVAAPGDMEEEVALLCREVNAYREQFADVAEIQLVAWSVQGDGIPLESPLNPQQAIAKRLPMPSACDIVLVLFGNRMGTRGSGQVSPVTPGETIRLTQHGGS